MNEFVQTDDLPLRDYPVFVDELGNLALGFDRDYPYENIQEICVLLTDLYLLEGFSLRTIVDYNKVVRLQYLLTSIEDYHHIFLQNLCDYIKENGVK